jgi:glutamate/tyrosine decarboxylase-like PLP-dependent enzyme
MDKLYAGTRPIGAVSELLIGVLNTNVHVFHVSPVLTLMEKNLILKLGSLMGYDGGHGGFLCPGGSYANLHAVVTARNYLFPEFVQNGSATGTAREFSTAKSTNAGSPYPYHHYEGPLQVLSSQHAHYSVINACLTLGLRHENIIQIPVDPQGRIIPSRVRQAIVESLKCRIFPASYGRNHSAGCI